MWGATLSLQHSVGIVVIAGLSCHQFYKRTENNEPIVGFILLVVAPLLLAYPLTQWLPSSLAIASTLVGYWATILSSIAFYRLSPWHPLAQYPGPILHILTKFRSAWLTKKGKQYINYDNLHKKYGDVVRVGPNELSIRNVNAVVPLYGTKGLPKGPYYDGRSPPYNATRALIAIRDPQEKARRRRPWGRAFSTAALKDYEKPISRHALNLIENLATQKGTVDIADWLSRFGYDFTSDFAFSAESDLIEKGDPNGFLAQMDGGQRDATFVCHVPWLGNIVTRYPWKYPALASKNLRAFKKYALAKGIERAQKAVQPRDLYYHLGGEGHVGKTKPSLEELINDAGLAIIAGSDTTSGVMANLLYYILTNPSVYERLKKEVDSLAGDVVNYEAQERLPYLTHVISESMRLLPPVLSGVHRATTKETGPVYLGGFYIPEGTSVFVPTYSLHRDERYFSPDPDSFVPERWMSLEDRIKLRPDLFQNENAYKLETSAFIPFSFGPANCVGQKLAWMVMRMVTCLIISNFDLEFEKGYDPRRWEEEIQDFFTAQKGRLPVVLTPRHL